MRILQLASEAVPYAKTGGLGDVVGALVRHLAEARHEVALLHPYYREVADAGFGDPHRTAARFSPSELGTAGEGRLIPGTAPRGARVWFLDLPELYDRDGLYGTPDGDHPDNLLRFAAFGRAALLAAERLEMFPDVVHGHDWQAGLSVAWFASRGIPTVFTIHNLAYQGWFPAVDRADADVAPGDLNLLRVGLLGADRVTTVSPTYAAEILGPEAGCGLDPVLRTLEPPVAGILNGIDTEVWNPADDPHLPTGWTADNLSGKREARRALAGEFGMEAPDGVPVFGMVARLVEQKGLGLIAELASRIGEWSDARFVLVGAGEPRFERLLRELAELPNVGARVAFDERLAHLVEGGADFFLMPSRFEPCGLNQMISQRYGTIPVVHRTGGLADSVTPATPVTLADGSASGIVFEHFDAAGLEWAIDEALRLYADRPVFERLRSAVMRLDHSWETRIARYEALYREVASPRAPAHVRP